MTAGGGMIGLEVIIVADSEKGEASAALRAGSTSLAGEDTGSTLPGSGAGGWISTLAAPVIAVTSAASSPSGAADADSLT